MTRRRARDEAASPVTLSPVDPPAFPAPGRGTAVPVPAGAASAAGAVTTTRDGACGTRERAGGGRSDPSLPSASGPVPGSPQASPGTEGGQGLLPARAVAAASSTRGGHGTPQTSPPPLEGGKAGMREGPGATTPGVGPPPAPGPGGAARGPVAAPPAPPRGLAGEEFRKTWKAAQSAKAKALRNGRSRYPAKRPGDGYGPGMTRRTPPGSGGAP